MYLKRLHSVNVGPIKDVEINFPFTSGMPKPVVIVGENGTGKSVLLSNIVDSFYEIASQKFNNAREKDAVSEGQQYYKVITSQEIHLGNGYMYSYLEYEHTSNSIYSIFKCGDISFQDFQKKEPSCPANMSWEDNNNFKKTSATPKDSNDIFLTNVICYLGPERYEKPNWMGNKYYCGSNYNISNFEHPSVREKWDGRLDKPISVANVNADTLQWLLDIIVDSRCDIAVQNESLQIIHSNLNDTIALGIARNNVENIMSTILGIDIYFGLNYRNSNISRFNINSKATNKRIVPALDALSTGQSALFNMFATIIRYADSDDINKSISLEEITGIVVIDEIDLHLHTNLQREVLPKLLKLFPKVQFIISSHAPLFLLGMDEVYGEDGYEIYQMPSATLTSSERFSEFQKAYNYLSTTEKHYAVIEEAIKKQRTKSLVITEGATDWKHLKHAFRKLKDIPDYKDYIDMDFEFLEYDPLNSEDENTMKLDMGKDELVAMCKQFSKIKEDYKMIFIADADDEKTTKALSIEEAPYKNWGNNVYSLVIPVPEHRSATPKICIEHYYTDEVLKQSVKCNGIERRLYMGNEFNNDGISLDGKLFCRDRNSCGANSIKIIDGTTEKRVYKIGDSEKTNLALSKMNFVKYIDENTWENNIFDSFHLIFDIIKQILNEPMI